MTVLPHSGPDGVAAPHSSGITVVIVGMGVGGLTAAIECHRKGHTVVGFEKSPRPTHLGDIFSVARNGARVLRKWGDGSMSTVLDSIRCAIESITVFDEQGTVREEKPMDGFRAGQGFVINRSQTVGALYAHAMALGLDLRFGVPVTDYREDEQQAWVLADGEWIGADCVVASDGMHSRARTYISGQESVLWPSGSAIYRCGFPADLLQGNPDAAWLIDGTETHDRLSHFIGKDVVVLMGTGGYGKEAYWSCMHKGVHSVSEPWLQESDISHALAQIRDWPIFPRLAAVIGQTPQGKCFDHLVMAAHPLPRWVSEQGRMILIGDAAHPFLPTTGQGATQAVEDAAVVAICLELAGRDQVPLGLRVMEKLRTPRVNLIQKGGLQVLDSLHKADWATENREEAPTMIVRPRWILGHDCQASTYAEFGTAADAVATGREYIPVNVPSDGSFRAVDEEGEGSE